MDIRTQIYPDQKIDLNFKFIYQMKSLLHLEISGDFLVDEYFFMLVSEDRLESLKILTSDFNTAEKERFFKIISTLKNLKCLAFNFHDDDDDIEYEFPSIEALYVGTWSFEREIIVNSLNFLPNAPKLKYLWLNKICIP